MDNMFFMNQESRDYAFKRVEIDRDHVCSDDCVQRSLEPFPPLLRQEFLACDVNDGINIKLSSGLLFIVFRIASCQWAVQVVQFVDVTQADPPPTARRSATYNDDRDWLPGSVPSYGEDGGDVADGHADSSRRHVDDGVRVAPSSAIIAAAPPT